MNKLKMINNIAPDISNRFDIFSLKFYRHHSTNFKAISESQQSSNTYRKQY